MTVGYWVGSWAALKAVRWVAGSVEYWADQMAAWWVGY